MTFEKEVDAVVLLSGGLGSFLAAALYQQWHPDKSIVLYFNDTKTEDPDLYRFLKECSTWLGGAFVDDSDGRHIWEVFRDVKYIANTRVDPCSDILKRKRARKWIKKNAPLAEIVIGIDWTEIHRLEGYQSKMKNSVVAPLCTDLRTKHEVYTSLNNPPELPSLYKYGFPHNNCGGGCVKAGLSQWQLLLDRFPERYKWHEDWQNKIMAENPKLKPFLRKTIDGETKYITLTEFRESYAKDFQTEIDFGGCGCAL